LSVPVESGLSKKGPLARVPFGWIIRKYVPVAPEAVEVPAVRRNVPTNAWGPAAVDVVDVAVELELQPARTTTLSPTTTATMVSRFLMILLVVGCSTVRSGPGPAVTLRWPGGPASRRTTGRGGTAEGWRWPGSW